MSNADTIRSCTHPAVVEVDNTLDSKKIKNKDVREQQKQRSEKSGQIDVNFVVVFFDMHWMVGIMRSLSK